MPIRKSPGRPRKDEPPAPSRKRMVRTPVDLDERFVSETVERGVSVQGAMREAFLVWILLGRDRVEQIVREAERGPEAP